MAGQKRKNNNNSAEILFGYNCHIMLLIAMLFANSSQAYAGGIGLSSQWGTYSSAAGISADGLVIVGSIADANSAWHGFKYSRGIKTDIGITSGADGVSGDGSVIVGSLGIPGLDSHAFKYTEDVMTDLGTLGGSFSIAKAVSYDGSVIVGHSAITGDAERHAYKYSGTTMTDLGTLGGSLSWAWGVSGDGSVIVGNSNISGNLGTHAYEYAGGVMTDLGTLGGSYSSASAASADGSVIVGASNIAGDVESHAFKYVGGVMTDIGTLGGIISDAFAVSADGSVIVGRSTITGYFGGHAFKYTGNSMIDLGTLGGTTSRALGVSADGSIIVGESSIPGDSTSHAFIYRTTMVDIGNVQTSLEINGRQLNSVVNLKTAILVENLNKDCKVYSSKDFCLSAGGSRYFNSGTYKAAQTVTDLKIGYRFSPKFRVGILMDKEFTRSDPGNFETSKTPLFGAFATLGDNERGLGAQLRLSAVGSNTDTNITRSVLAYTEAGRGKSRLKSYGLQAELGYSLKISSPLELEPFVGIRKTQFARKAYTEIVGATFPISYKEMTRNQTTIITGLRANLRLSKLFAFDTVAGLEHDNSSRNDAYAGTIDILGPFEFSAPLVKNNRAFATLGFSCNISPTQQLSVKLGIRKQSLENTAGNVLTTQYSLVF